MDRQTDIDSSESRVSEQRESSFIIDIGMTLMSVSLSSLMSSLFQPILHVSKSTLEMERGLTINQDVSECVCCVWVSAYGCVYVHCMCVCVQCLCRPTPHWLWKLLHTIPELIHKIYSNFWLYSSEAEEEKRGKEFLKSIKMSSDRIDI